MRTGAATLLGIVMLVCPAVAVGQTTTLPPGGSEADQYSETVPGGGGEGPIDRSDGAEEVASGEPGGSLLSAEELADVAAQGRDGRAAAELAAGGAPEERSGPAGGPGASDSEAAETSAGPSPTGQGLGPLLPLILAFVAVASLGFALSRRQAHTPEAS